MLIVFSWNGIIDFGYKSRMIYIVKSECDASGILSWTRNEKQRPDGPVLKREKRRAMTDCSVVSDLVRIVNDCFSHTTKTSLWIQPYKFKQADLLAENIWRVIVAVSLWTTEPSIIHMEKLGGYDTNTFTNLNFVNNFLPSNDLLELILKFYI